MINSSNAPRQQIKEPDFLSVIKKKYGNMRLLLNFSLNALICIFDAVLEFIIKKYMPYILSKESFVFLTVRQCLVPAQK